MPEHSTGFENRWKRWIRRFVRMFPYNLQDGWLNQHIFKVTPETGLVREEYFFFLMKWLKPVFKKIAANKQTTGLGHVTLADLKRIQVTIPSFEVQERIERILCPLDFKIRLNNQLNDYLFELVSSVFAHRFSDNVNTTELKNVLSISTKALKPQEHADEIWEHHSIPAFDEKHRPIFEPASGIKSNKYQIDSECILISKLNPSTKRIWMPCCSSNNAVCSTEFIVYRPYLKEYKSFYYAAIDSPRFTDYLLEHVSGSTGSRQRAQPKDTLNYLMPNPDNEEIKNFCTFADPIYRHIQINEQQTAKLELLRETLLPKLMSGEIDVSKVDLMQLTNNHLVEKSLRTIIDRYKRHARSWQPTRPTALTLLSIEFSQPARSAYQPTLQSGSRSVG